MNSYFDFKKICLSLFVLAIVLSGCTTNPPIQSYDFGVQNMGNNKTNPQTRELRLLIVDIKVPGNLDGNAMLYRLNYDHSQELRPYAQNRWSVPPAQLFTQRLKQAINVAGGAALSVNDGVKDMPQLRLELDEFSQHFTSPQRSAAHIQLRASLIYKNGLVAQRPFTSLIEASSADAKGGAIAMTRASDQLIDQLLQWAQQELLSAKLQ